MGEVVKDFFRLSRTGEVESRRKARPGEGLSPVRRSLRAPSVLRPVPLTPAPLPPGEGSARPAPQARPWRAWASAGAGAVSLTSVFTALVMGRRRGYLALCWRHSR